MIATLLPRRFADPSERQRRLVWAGVLLLGLVILAVWNPVQRPGPILCPSRLLLAFPCALCGVTRGVALCLRGQAVESVFLNPLSPAVCLLLLLQLARWSGEYLIDRRLVLVWTPLGRRLHLVGLATVLLLTWVWVLLYRWDDSFADSLVGRLLAWLSAHRTVQ